MGDSTMEHVLQDLNLKAYTKTFIDEKITPDIVCKLSSHEMEALGVSSRADMMRLRTECVKYGTDKPQRVRSQCGPPNFDIPKSILENFLENGCEVSYISKLLTVSQSTIYRRMAAFGLSKRNFSQISDNELDVELGKILKDFPLCGENLLKQMLIIKRIRVPRWRLRESVHRMDSRGVRERQTGRLHRRVYNVMGPNHLWHIDTNHKLVRWRFVIVGGIDGFSRLIMFLKCTDNNISETLLQCFLSGVDKFGIPNRVRSDKGMENVSVADFMLSKKGLDSMITGKSTHNQRIERLWRDVYDGVLSFFYNIFYHMEDQGILDPLNQIHLATLHYIFISEINKKLEFWRDAWAGHRLRTARSSPLNLWTSGQLQNPVGLDGAANLQNYGVEGFVDQNDVEDGERPIFASLAYLINEQCRDIIAQEFIRNGNNFGIDDFLRC
ncbi:unnamed protein product [Mytilus edulis]|uniref:Integrase catalytic domain-containing protein n=1 Tax=Mytilus edulis TaxID=6550 RepID=A0A8S3R0A0_MYTED|nr:unnamed protein product [Mytilus edulis]